MMHPHHSQSPTATCEGVMRLCVDSMISKIRNYPDEQLQALLSDEQRLSEMINAMPQVSSLQSDKELKLAQSKSFAECNLSMEPKLREQRATLQSTYDEAVRIKAEVEQLKGRLDSVAETRSLDTVLALLQASTQEAEDESEAIAERFQQGDVEIDDFIKEFGEKRSTAHLRKVKAEKLAEILRQQQYQQYHQQAQMQPHPHHPGSVHPYHASYAAAYQRHSSNRFA